MPKRCWLRSAAIAALCISALPAWAQVRVEIPDVGIHGAVSSSASPVLVSVRLTNPAEQAVSVDLQVHLRYVYMVGGKDEYITHEALSLKPGESRTVDVPVAYPFRMNELAIAEARSSNGDLLGHAERNLGPRPQGDHVVALVCDTDVTCEGVQNAILFSGSTPERTAKSNGLRIITLKDVPDAGWMLGTASTVVVAEPETSLSTAQRGALEWYLRTGGRLVLLEEALRGGRSAAPADFLSAYRQTKPDGALQLAGRGELRDVANEKGPQLGALFITISPTGEVTVNCGCETNSAFEALRQGLSTPIHFPGLGWLLGWMTAYVLVIGVVNFSILQKLGKREWAWVTMPAFSLLFAAALYAATSARRPPEYILDDLSLNWMDDRSEQAGVERSIRVFSPRQGEITVAAEGEDVLTHYPWTGRFGPELESSFSFQPAKLLDVRLGRPQDLRLSLAQWSSARLDFEGVRKLAGTVHWTGAARLKNETGISFREAVYARGEEIRVLGSIAAGAEVDLQSVPKLSRQAYFAGKGEESLQQSFEPARRHRGTGSPSGPGAFRLASVLGSLLSDMSRTSKKPAGLFLGLSDVAAGASIEARQAIRNAHAVTIVFLGSQP